MADKDKNLETIRNGAAVVAKTGRLARVFDAVRTGGELEAPTLASGATILGRSGAVITTFAKPVAYTITAYEVIQDAKHGDYKEAATKTAAISAAVYAGGQCAVAAAPLGPIGMFVAGGICGGVTYWGAKKAAAGTYDIAADVVQTGGTHTRAQLSSLFDKAHTPTTIAQMTNMSPGITWAPPNPAVNSAMASVFKP